jgi:hypothetical protein
MIDLDLQAYLDGKFDGLNARVDTLDKEANHLRRHLLTEDKAQSIFNAKVLRLNSYTRLAVALIAAVALIGNGAQNVLANHDSIALQLRCDKGASDALSKWQLQSLVRDEAIAQRAASQALKLRDAQYDVIRGAH